VPDPGRPDWGPADGRHPPGQTGRPPGFGQQPPAVNVPGSRDHGWRAFDIPQTPSATSSLVRPYTVTGGRTKPRYQLQIEAMVAASHYEARDLSVLSPECQSILEFCRDWRSVAEISAVLRMPLGVVRVLIADMAMEGLVRVHQLDHAQGRPDLNLLERVLSGLRKL
jgi:Protein of unknown function (DUF742)